MNCVLIKCHIRKWMVVLCHSWVLKILRRRWYEGSQCCESRLAFISELSGYEYEGSSRPPVVTLISSQINLNSYYLSCLFTWKQNRVTLDVFLWEEGKEREGRHSYMNTTELSIIFEVLGVWARGNEIKGSAFCFQSSESWFCKYPRPGRFVVVGSHRQKRIFAAFGGFYRPFNTESDTWQIKQRDRNQRPLLLESDSALLSPEP